jgi:hypothetical protein
MTQHFTNVRDASSRRLPCFGPLCGLARLDLRQAVVARACGWFLAIAVMISGLPSLAQEPMPLDYQVKAAFLVNFPKYVDWPANTFAEPNSPIVVAVFGDDNVADEFQSMIQDGLVISGHPVVLKKITKEAEIGRDCQILYIAASERPEIPNILAKVQGLGILTVGETEGFLESGGIINLVPKNHKIRLQVNLTAAGRAHLKISSRLLVAADVVEGKQN